MPDKILTQEAKKDTTKITVNECWKQGHNNHKLLNLRLKFTFHIHEKWTIK